MVNSVVLSLGPKEIRNLDFFFCSRVSGEKLFMQREIGKL